MGYPLNHLDEPVFMAVPKPMLTEFGIHHRLESCGQFQTNLNEMTLSTKFSQPVENMKLNYV